MSPIQTYSWLLWNGSRYPYSKFQSLKNVFLPWMLIIIAVILSKRCLYSQCKLIPDVYGNNSSLVVWVWHLLFHVHTCFHTSLIKLQLWKTADSSVSQCVAQRQSSELPRDTGVQILAATWLCILTIDLPGGIYLARLINLSQMPTAEVNMKLELEDVSIA